MAILAFAACIACIGCADLGSGQWESGEAVAWARTTVDVERVLALYEKSPWLIERDADVPVAVGIRVSSLYLISSKTGKGVFGDGTIRFILQSAERVGSHTKRGAKLCEWRFDQQEAVDWRVTERSWMGNGYQFDLPWPDGVDPRDEAVALTVEFLRSDGKIVRSSPKYFRVPASL